MAAGGAYGAKEPWAEPYWYSGLNSPYYKDTHRQFRARVRAFVEKEIMPYIDEWEEAGDYPPELRQKAYAAGIYATIYPPQYGGTPPPQLDAFHDLILTDELARCGSGGLLFACFFSFAIALPPVLAHGSQYLKDLVARDVITGQKIMALCVTEPWGGSDVAAVRTTALKQGDHYVLNGEKKFITSGNKVRRSRHRRVSRSVRRTTSPWRRAPRPPRVRRASPSSLSTRAPPECRCGGSRRRAGG